jgi:hypothetical protein
VKTRCYKCQVERDIVYVELIRSVNAQSKYVSSYHCPSCYRNLNAVKEAAKARSDAMVTPEFIERCRVTSVAMWKRPEYVEKCLVAAYAKSQSTEFAAKVSTAICKKFAEDESYVDKVRLARRRYWDMLEYRASRTWDKNKFITESIKIHGALYSYDCTEYISFNHKVNIECRKHGQFSQLPGHHIYFGNGCPICARLSTISSQQSSIADWLTSIGEVVEVSNRSALGGLEIDVFIPNRSIGIEYHGLYWHSHDSRETSAQRYRHHFKQTLAERAGVRLLQLYEDEWRDSRSIVESMILSRLGRNKVIGARKCDVQQVDELNSFFSTNHLQGERYAPHNFSLVFDGETVAGLSLASHKNGGYELMRFASIVGVNVVGGLSRLITHVRRALGNQRLFTYVDRRYGVPLSYQAAGFKLLRITPPGYRYVRNGLTFSRTSFQKHKLAAKLPVFDASQTEFENMVNNGYRRIWDAGHYCLEMV